MAAAPTDAHFADDPAALYAQAGDSALTDGAGVLVLDADETYVFDGAGGLVQRSYLAYRVLSQEGAKDWGDVEIEWEPWREERPQVHARVLTPDRKVHELDAKSITDAPSKENQSSIFSDRRVMRAPLAAVAPGSIVEREFVRHEREPFAGAGFWRKTYVGLNVPVLHSRVSLDAPAALPLKYVTQLLPVTPHRSEGDGRVRVDFDAGPLPAVGEVEANLPADVAAYPSIVLTTGASWESIARSYRQIVDEQIGKSDLAAVSAKLTAGLQGREARVQAILAYVNQEVRYTGVEFGEAAYVPRPPSETLARRYGDCKDKATLLVALLRQAGVAADVALLNAGDRMDLPPDLPSGSPFDHEIVHLPGDPEYWIDATATYSRLGELPSADRGRWALVVGEATNSLAQIPEAQSTDNVIYEDRLVTLAESGPASVVETSKPRGSFQADFRGEYVDKNDKHARDNLTDYMSSEYLAEKLDRVERSDPLDFSRPFELVLESKRAGRGATDLDSAVAVILPRGLFIKLPEQLRTRQKEARGDDDDAAHDRRASDLLLDEAFSAQWSYRIVPPPGFVHKPLPHDVDAALGPARFSAKFTVDADEVIHADLRFDTVKRRLSAAEVTEMRSRVADVREGEPIWIRYEPAGKALLDAGRVGDSLRAYRDLIAMHPKEAVHHLQLANALLAAGLGEAARKEARLAAALEPKSLLAQKTLAEVLEHDLVGRNQHAGADFAGAAAAFRVAQKLDPKDRSITSSLAILLEYDARGMRYSATADLRGAIAEYRKLGKADLKELELNDNLAFAQFYAGDFAQCRVSLATLNPQPKALAAACTAGVEGLDEGLAEAHRRASDEADFKNVARTAGSMLLKLRQYPLAAGLLEAGASGDNAAQTMGLAAILAKARRHEELHFDGTPEGLVREWIATTFRADLSVADLTPISSRNARKAMALHDALGKSTAVHEVTDKLGRMLANAGMSVDVAIDITLPSMQPRAEGSDATAYRVRTQLIDGKTMVFYVVREDGRYRMLDVGETFDALALEVLDRIERKDLVTAKLLLDWVREESALGSGDDPLDGSRFGRLWAAGAAADDPAAMKVAAGALLARTEAVAKQGAGILEQARAQSTEAAAQNSLDLALLTGYVTLQDFAGMLRVSAELGQRFPESKVAFLHQVSSLNTLGRHDEAEALAQAWLLRLPRDREAFGMLGEIAVSRGDFKGAYGYSQKVVDTGKGTASDMNQLAWRSLFFERDAGPDLDSAIRAAQLQPNSSAILHTLGCVYAVSGKTKEAREVLLRAMDLDSVTELTPAYQLAFGLIAEQYGEADLAAANYREVKPPEGAAPQFESAYRLAQRRLALIGAKVTAAH